MTTLTPCLPSLSLNAFGFGKRVRVPGKHAIALHVIDVEMNHIERQIAFAILADNFLDHRVRVITPTALLIAERPQRRHWHVTGEIGVTAQNFLYRWAIEEVVVQLAAFGAKPRALLRRFAEVKIAAIAVVEKDAVSDAVLQTDIETGWFDRSDLCLRCSRACRNSS